VIVVANSPRMRRYRRRRHYRARTPPIFHLPGMLVFGVGGMFGAEAADMASRYWLGLDPSANPAPTLPAGITSIGQYNDLVMAAPPSLKRVGIELGVAVLGWLGGGLAARASMGLLALFGYGFGFGAAFHIGTAVIDGYLIQPLFVSNNTLSNNGQRMYQHEFNAKTAKDAAKQGGGTLGQPGVSRNGTPVVARALPAARPTDRVPTALATLGQTPRAEAMRIAMKTNPENLSPFPQDCTRDMGGCPPAGYVPPAAPPVATPTNGGGQTMTPQAAMGNGCVNGCSVPGGCAPDCNCRSCQLGQPPQPQGGDGYVHPMMRTMIAGPGMRYPSRRRAA
jgi:hypothetical protein